MRANAAEREQSLLKDVIELYAWQQRNNSSGKQWLTHDGPPYANGDLHIGHALNKILKDIINRYKMMRGYKVDYIPGWDCHGLPIELKALEKTKSDSTPSSIREIAREFALNEIRKQKAEFVSWGIIGDWNRPYLTMDPSYEVAQLDVFHSLYKNGFIYRGIRPVHWSPSSRTALADAELEYNDNHSSKSIFVSFKVRHRSIDDVKDARLGRILDECSRQGNLSAVIWTTTPWSIPANLAICVHPDIEYCIVKSDDRSNFFILAKSMLPDLRTKLNLSLEEFSSISFKGSDLVGLICEHPFIDRQSPVLTGDHVTTSAGTGLVHTAPAHGPEDFQLGIKHGLTIVCPVDDNGKFTTEAGDRLVGKSVLSDGTQEVIDMLREKGSLVHSSVIVHRYPYDWRTKKPVIIRTTKQWFVDLTSVQKIAVDAIEGVDMIPSSGKSRLSSMVNGRADWCISRQRVWGLPLPVFYEVETAEPLITDETIDHIKRLFARHGSDCWFNLPVEDLLPPSLRANASRYVKGMDTMDVWFDSGSSWRSVLVERGCRFPADLYLEGSDQHRGWFQSSLLTSISVTGKAPYKTVITHGFTLDEKGQKMSKSLGNVVSPSLIVGGGKDKKRDPAYGVDVMRMMMASSDYTKDINIGPTVISKVHESLKKFRNTLRFALSNLYDFKPSDSIEYDQLSEIDRYILHKLNLFVAEVTCAYESFNFNKVYRDLINFATNDLSSFYFDVIKHRLYVGGHSDRRRRSSQTVLYILVDSLSKLIAPIAPHLSEELYNHTPRSQASDSFDSVFCKGWVDVTRDEWNRPELADKWAVVLSIRQAVNALLETARSKKVIGRSEEAEVRLFVDDSRMKSILESLEPDELSDVFLVSETNVSPLSSSSTMTFEPDRSDVFSTDITIDSMPMRIQVQTSPKQKCPRCWRKKSDGRESPCSECQQVLEREASKL